MVEVPKSLARVFREVCTDSRKPVSEIAASTGLSRGIVRARIRELESEYGIHYVPEFNYAKLGVDLAYAIQVKLKREIDSRKLASALSASKLVQFAARTKGDFDLFIFVGASNHVEFIRWEHKFRSDFAGEIACWEPVHVVFNRLGFFPMNDATVGGASLPREQKLVLLELNRNARASYCDIAKATGLTMAVVRYQVKKIIEFGYVKRFSAVIEETEADVKIIVFATYEMQADHEERSKRSRRILKRADDYELLNHWAMVSATSGTADTLRLGSFGSVEDAFETIQQINEVYGGPDLIRNRIGVVIRILAGKWPGRNVDMDKCYDSTGWAEKEK